MLSLEDDAVFVGGGQSGGVQFVIGVDEAGRGCMAGPVCVAATCFRLPPSPARPNDNAASSLPLGLRDSKTMTPAARTTALEALVVSLLDGPAPWAVQHVLQPALHSPEKRVTCVARHARAPSQAVVGFSVVLVDAAVIDAVNILNATLEAMSLVCAELVTHLRDAGVDVHAGNTIVLIDGNRTPWQFRPEGARRLLREKVAKTGRGSSAIGHVHPALDAFSCRTVVGGDGKLYAVAAASVVAKVVRDSFASTVMHARCPVYDFQHHKGYVTAAHAALLAQHGPCEFHRRSFAPVAAVCGTAALTVDGAAAPARKRAAATRASEKTGRAEQGGKRRKMETKGKR